MNLRTWIFLIIALWMECSSTCAVATGTPSLLAATWIIDLAYNSTSLVAKIGTAVDVNSPGLKDPRDIGAVARQLPMEKIISTDTSVKEDLAIILNNNSWVTQVPISVSTEEDRTIIMDSLTEICSSKCQVVMDDSATVSIEEGRTINVDGHALNSGQSSKSNQE